MTIFFCHIYITIIAIFKHMHMKNKVAMLYEDPKLDIKKTVIRNIEMEMSIHSLKYYYSSNLHPGK